MSLDCTCNRLKEAEEKAAKWDAIVRCKDCEHSYGDGTLCLMLGESYYDSQLGELVDNPAFVDPSGYCYLGERRKS